MKIGIVTLHGYFNYGNRLQNYALVNTLQKMNHEVDTIVLKTNKLGPPSLTERIFKKRSILDYLRIPERLISRVGNKKYLEFLEAKEIKLKRFSKEHLNEVFVDIVDLESMVLKYDYFIAGSDQIWHEGSKSFYFLEFSPKEKNISYAASIGTDFLTTNHKKFILEKIHSIRHVSVREITAQNVIFDLVGYRPEIVLDPVFLLSQEQWNELASKSLLDVSKPYLVTYFLNKGSFKKVNIFAKKRGLVIINLYHPFNKIFTKSSVEDFVRLISNSSYIFTDSYHAMLFSIIFNKKFVVFSRGNMNTRFDTILTQLKLKDRYNQIDNIDKHINYEDVNRSIRILVEKSMKFLERSIC